MKKIKARLNLDVVVEVEIPEDLENLNHAELCDELIEGVKIEYEAHSSVLLRRWHIYPSSTASITNVEKV